MKTLLLVLTYHWYDETISGRKLDEYRAKTKPDGTPSKWMRDIWSKRDEITHVQYQRGYTITKTPVYEVTGIAMGPCPIDGWDDEYIVISRRHASERPKGSV